MEHTAAANSPDRKAIVVGASSGIGRELAKLLALDGYTVGLAARREELLRALQAELAGRSLVKPMDVSRIPECMLRLEELIREMGGVDLVVMSAGTGSLNPDLDWERERVMIDVNVSGFAALTNVTMRHFFERGAGHLVGISSVAAWRGGREAPAYNASKAFMSNYLQGLRQWAGRAGIPIVVTDIKPGFVDTRMAQGDGKFWVASPEEAARQILRAIRKKRSHAYVTRRWRLVAWLLRLVPEAFYNKL